MGESAAAAADALGVRYGHRIRLATTSAYASADSSGSSSNLLGIGYYEKNGRHGILSCVPPLGDKLAHLFTEDEYLVLDPSEARAPGEPVLYGQTVVLVNQHGMVWNNKTGGITGYVGPRPRNIPGEMFVAFRRSSPPSLSSGSSTSSSSTSSAKDKTMSAPALLSSSPSEGTGEAAVPVRYGDQDVAIVVVESNRHSQMFNKRLSNFKKPTSRIAGGYICCDGKGVGLKFTVCPARPRVEQIAMLNKLITAYNYGQKIALPLALLESSIDQAKANGGLHHAEIRFSLSNQATAVLPGALLQEKLLAHAAADDADDSMQEEKESIFVLPLRNGPGELVLKLIGVAPKRTIGKIASAGSSSSSSATSSSLLTRSAVIGNSRNGADGGVVAKFPKLSIFYKVVDVLRLVPLPVFALLYAVVTHFLWSSLSVMEDGLKRELVVLVLVVFPAFYVAVKVEHPFSSLFEPPSVEPARFENIEAPSTATLKLIVMEYRFTPSTLPSGSASSVASKAPATLTTATAVAIGSSTSTSTTVIAAASTNSTHTTPPTTVVTTSTGLPKRFLLAEKGDEAKGLARYTETMAWRREEKLSQILFVPSPNFKIIKENYPHYYHKRGKNGEPVYYEKPGKINLKALKGAGLNLDDLMHNYIMVTEFLWQVIEPDDNKKCISVVDVEGIRISDFRGEAVEYLKKAAAVSGKHYPERCAYIIVINIPSWFNVIWNVVKNMIDEVTREKVVMVRGKKNILEALMERIPLENIPEEYGGLSEGSSPEETMLHDLMAYLNKDADAPATNPIAHIVKQENALLAN